MTATDADRIRAAELWGRDWPAGIFDIAAALAEARAEAGEERDRALEAVMSAQAKAARLREELDRLRADAEQQARAREAQAWDRGYGAGDRDAYKAAEARQWNGRDLGDDERETNPSALTAEDPAARP